MQSVFAIIKAINSIDLFNFSPQASIAVAIKELLDLKFKAFFIIKEAIAISSDLTAMSFLDQSQYSDKAIIKEID